MTFEKVNETGESMTTNILIGNAIAVFAAVFTVLSSFSHGKKKIYGYQVLQCFFQALAQIFFFSYSGLTTLFLCAVRNALVAYDKFTKKLCIVFMILITVCGLAANNRGLLGLLPIVTTLIYTLGSYLLNEDYKIKMNIVLNSVLWALYDFMVFDIVSGILDTGAAIVTIAAVIREKTLRNEKCASDE